MSGEYYEQVVQGPARVYVGALGVITAPPADAAVNTTPAASAWTDVQGTSGGVTWSHTPKTSTLNVDQVAYDIDARLTNVNVQVVTVLANVSLANLALALNTTVGATGAGYATLEPKYGPGDGIMPTISLLVDGFAPLGTLAATPRRRLYLPRANQTGKVEAVYARDKMVGWAVTWDCYYVSDSVAPYHITDQTV
jgi:lipoprotein-anchoring transpeptidase ErfK/SrfK